MRKEDKLKLQLDFFPYYVYKICDVLMLQRVENKQQQKVLPFSSSLLFKLLALVASPVVVDNHQKLLLLHQKLLHCLR